MFERNKLREAVELQDEALDNVAGGASSWEQKNQEARAAKAREEGYIYAVPDKRHMVPYPPGEHSRICKGQPAHDGYVFAKSRRAENYNGEQCFAYEGLKCYICGIPGLTGELYYI